MAQMGLRPVRRSFKDEVEARVSNLADVSTRRLGPHRCDDDSAAMLLCTVSGAGAMDRPWVMISGGVHGDEIAGVYAAVKFLESRVHAWKQWFQFAVLPCINPGGFEMDTLLAKDGTNLNRVWGVSSRQPEIAAVENWLKEFGQKFLVTFDLHEIAPDYRGEGFIEADNPRGCYLYETVTDASPRIGRAMIDALPAGSEVCRWPLIYHDRNDGGVVSYPQACGNEVYARETTLDAFLNGRYTGHSFTLETPMGWPLEKRVATHLVWLETALKLLRNPAASD